MGKEGDGTSTKNEASVPTDKVPAPDADSGNESRHAFAALLSNHGFEDVLVLAREEAPKLCHGRRLEILDYLSTHEPQSVSALGRALGHNKGEISRDLHALADLDIVELQAEGKAKAPRLAHSQIVIEPVVGPATPPQQKSERPDG